MPQKTQITYLEPADRPVAVNLSAGEIYALIKHHEKTIKTVSRAAVKAIGQHANTAADIKSVRKEAEREIDAHIKRAKGLSAILSELIH